MSGFAALGLLMSSATHPAEQPDIADSSVEFVLSGVEHRADDVLLVDVRILNHGTTARSVALPYYIDAVWSAASPGQERSVRLVRADGAPKAVALAQSGFVRARYLSEAGGLSLVMPGGFVSVPAWGGGQMALLRDRKRVTVQKESHADASPAAATGPMAEPVSPTEMAEDARHKTAIQDTLPTRHENVAVTGPQPSRLSSSDGHGFVANLSTYEPIYAVYGPGTNTEARLQISFKYRLFGSRRYQDRDPSWREGLHFAYTQRMFWDLAAKSSPFRNIDYQPEIFYSAPSVLLKNGTTVTGQMGMRHESNGRDGALSRSLNTIYFAPMASWALDDGYRLRLVPRLSFLVGNRSDNPDINHYRGITALYAELGSEDGWRFSAMMRYNFSSGKGSILADVSYPLTKILDGGPDFYLFGQGFAGYGENLLDYNRQTTRFRIGFGIAR